MVSKVSIPTTQAATTAYNAQVANNVSLYAEPVNTAKASVAVPAVANGVDTVQPKAKVSPTFIIVAIVALVGMGLFFIFKKQQ